MLSAGEVEQLLDPDALLDALADEFKALSEDAIIAPGRSEVSTGDPGFLLTMPVYRPGREITVKLVSVFHGNDALGAPSHQALICLFDAVTGTPVCIMDGAYITAMRTAGAAALSTRELARDDARTLAIVGAGVQGACATSVRFVSRRGRSPMRNGWPNATNGRAPSRRSRRQCATPMSSVSAPTLPMRCCAASGWLLARMSPRWGTGHLAGSWAAT
jgi:hypothetical protein